ncbi:MAG: DMT family transporter [Pseudomonadota bacterium]
MSRRRLRAVLYPELRPCQTRGMLTRLYAHPPTLLILTALMWATNAIAGQLAVGHVTPYALVLLRWVFVVAVMWPLYGRSVIEHWPTIREKLAVVIFMAIAGFTGFNTLFYVASVHTSGLNIGILQGAMPVIVMLGAYLVYRDKVTPKQSLGVIVTLVGAATIAARGDISALLALAFNYGDMLMFAAILLYCSYTVAVPKRPQAPAITLFTFFSVIALIAALPLALWEAAQPNYPWPTMQGWLVTIFVAIFPSCLAQIFFLRGVDLIGPGRAGVYINLVPVFTAILAVALLGEVFAAYHALALVLVLCGIWLTQKP